MRLEDIVLVATDFSIPETGHLREDGERPLCPYSPRRCDPDCPLSVTFVFSDKLTTKPHDFTFCSKNPFVAAYAEKIRGHLEHELAGVAVGAVAKSIFAKNGDSKPASSQKAGEIPGSRGD